MAIKPIKIYGCPVLRQKAVKIEEMTEQIRRLLRDLRDSLYYSQGVGLAANQIGEARQLFMTNVNKELVVCLNPVIISAEAKVVSEEGCLSLPEIYVDIERATSVELEYLDENWRKQQIKADGLLARVIQHEIDHLNGVLIADRASFVARKMIAGKLRRLQKKVQAAY